MQGRVRTDSFFEKLAELSPNKGSKRRESLESLSDIGEISTTSEGIIQRLKKLKEKALFKEDNESVEDINW